MSNDKPKPAPKKPNSLGPVSTLETHVKSDWWNKIFNALYLKTDGDVVEDLEITRKEVDSFTEVLGVKKDQQILDLCCGQGRHSLEWARRGYQVTGMDRSRFLIQKARSRSKKEGLNVTWKEGDARKPPFQTDRFDFVSILGNSFGYFESLEEDLEVLRQVKRVLVPGGTLLLDVTDGGYLKEKYEPRSWEWINKEMFVCRERSLSSNGSKLISREVITDISKGVIADQFYAERLYSQVELEDLLKTAGFVDIRFLGELFTNSKRDQDLGMMSKRLIFTAKVDKDWSKVKKKPKQEVQKIAVLLGDPRKTDIIKPDGTFDEDDFYTLNQLKSALTSLEDYSFQFLDNHNNYLTDIPKLKGKVDLIFNLCDEGFNNNARSELHVPALLEMLDLPYTGANPQSLAFCYDKSLVRGTARELGLPVSEAFLVGQEDNVFELPISFPVLIKPNMGDSSFGITKESVVYNMEELMEGIARVRAKQGYEKPLLIEEFLPGKDVSFGLIGNLETEILALPLIEEDYSSLPPGLPQICGYEAKWLPDSPYGGVGSIPAHLPQEIEKIIIDSSLALFRRLECRDYCRFDWRLDKNGNPKLLEVNPNPGWCWDGHLAKMAGFTGISYREMLNKILKAAQARVASASHS